LYSRSVLYQLVPSRVKADSRGIPKAVKT